MSENETGTEAFEAARARRIKVNVAITNVERAAARASSKPAWREKVVAELRDLAVAFDQHVEEVEGEDGLLSELRLTAPRLSNKIERVQSEHPGLRSMIADTVESVRTSNDPDADRAMILDTLVAIARHRQSGADLAYEGYSVDIGGG